MNRHFIKEDTQLVNSAHKRILTYTTNYSKFLHNSPKLEAIQMSFKWANA